MYSLILSISFALCLLSTNSLAEEVLTISLPTTAERVRQHNPDLVAARYLIEEAQGRHQQSGVLDNPSLHVEYSQNSGVDERELTIGFSQKFPLTDRLQIAKRVTEGEWQQAAQEVQQVERELIMTAQMSVVRILALRKRQQLLEQQATMLREFAETLQRVAAQGEGSLLDARQAQVECDMFTLEMKQLRVSEATAISRLKILLGVEPQQQVVVAGALERPQSYEQTAQVHLRADYQAAQHRVESARERVNWVRAQRYEDIEVGVFAGWSREHELAGQYENKTLMGVQLTIPLPLWNRKQGALLEAQARLRRREHEQAALVRRVQLQVATERGEMAQWADLYREIEEELVPQAAAQATLVEEAYAQGMAEVSRVLRAQERQVQLQLAKWDALREYHLARVRYEASVSFP